MENRIKYIFNSTHKIFDDEQFELNTSSIAHTKYLTTSNGEYN